MKFNNDGASVRPARLHLVILSAVLWRERSCVSCRTAMLFQYRRRTSGPHTWVPHSRDQREWGFIFPCGNVSGFCDLPWHRCNNNLIATYGGMNPESNNRKREFLIGLSLPPLPVFASLIILGRGVSRSPQEPYLTTGTTALIVTAVLILALSAFWWRSRRWRACGLLASLFLGSVLVALLALLLLTAMKGAITG